MPAIAPVEPYGVVESPVIAGTPTVLAMPGWEDGPENYSGLLAAALVPNNGSGFAHPNRNGALPNATVGGFTEWSSPSRELYVNYPGISTGRTNVPFTGEGNYDAVPTWNDRPTPGGSGTPNVHGKSLLQGVLTQIGGYNPPSPASSLSYVAALASPSSVTSAGNAVTG